MPADAADQPAPPSSTAPGAHTPRPAGEQSARRLKHNVRRLETCLEFHLRLLDICNQPVRKETAKFSQYRSRSWLARQSTLPVAFQPAWELFLLELDRMTSLTQCCLFFDLLVRVQTHPSKGLNLRGIATLDPHRLFGKVDSLLAASSSVVSLLEVALVDPKTKRAQKEINSDALLNALRAIKSDIAVEYMSTVSEAVDYLLAAEDQCPLVGALVEWCNEHSEEDQTLVNTLLQPASYAVSYPGLIRAVAYQCSASIRTTVWALSLQIETLFAKVEKKRKRRSVHALEALDAHLNWRPPIAASPEMYIPKGFHTQLIKSPAITLDSALKRRGTYQAPLMVLSSTGKTSTKLHGHLVDHLLILIQPLPTARGMAPQQESYAPPLPVLDLHIVSELPDDPHDERAFLLLQRGPLGEIQRFFSFKCSSASQKAEWVQRLRDAQHKALQGSARRLWRHGVADSVHNTAMYDGVFTASDTALRERTTSASSGYSSTTASSGSKTDLLAAPPGGQPSSAPDLDTNDAMRQIAEAMESACRRRTTTHRLTTDKADNDVEAERQSEELRRRRELIAPARPAEHRLGRSRSLRRTPRAGSGSGSNPGSFRRSRGRAPSTPAPQKPAERGLSPARGTTGSGFTRSKSVTARPPPAPHSVADDPTTPARRSSPSPRRRRRRSTSQPPLQEAAIAIRRAAAASPASSAPTAAPTPSSAAQTPVGEDDGSRLQTRKCSTPPPPFPSSDFGRCVSEPARASTAVVSQPERYSADGGVGHRRLRRRSASQPGLVITPAGAESDIARTARQLEMYAAAATATSTGDDETPPHRRGRSCGTPPTADTWARASSSVSGDDAALCSPGHNTLLSVDSGHGSDAGLWAEDDADGPETLPRRGRSCSTPPPPFPEDTAAVKAAKASLGQLDVRRRQSAKRGAVASEVLEDELLAIMHQSLGDSSTG